MKSTNAYGGDKTRVLDIEIGREFWVHNGAWVGIISLDDNGNKLMNVFDGAEWNTHKITEDETRELYITYRLSPNYKFSMGVQVKLGMYSKFKVNDIVKSRKQQDTNILYKVVKVLDTDVVCLRLDDLYEYTIPKEDLYVWVLAD